MRLAPRPGERVLMLLEFLLQPLLLCPPRRERRLRRGHSPVDLGALRSLRLGGFLLGLPDHGMRGRRLLDRREGGGDRGESRGFGSRRNERVGGGGGGGER